MNFDALKGFRKKLASRRSTVGLWVTLESPSITEMAVMLGLDWVVIDAEHGHLDWKEIVEHLRASVRSSTVVLVRIAELNVGLIKRALDIGADGVVIPWIESAEQLRQALSFSKYPPEGVRGIGAERATAWGQAFAEHTRGANESVLIIPIIETVRGARQLASMLQLDGVECFFFGPADLSASMGYRGEWEGPGVAQQILLMKEAVHAAGKSCGIMASSMHDLQQRIAQGFQMVGLGTDAGLLVRMLRENLSSIKLDCVPKASLEPCAIRSSVPLLKLPESFRPDRPEVAVAFGDGLRTELAPGVVFECQLGKQIGARNLTTGYVRFAPGSELSYHSHEFSESVTLISGQVRVEVEGRQYTLDRMDNITIPHGLAHAAINSSREDCTVHVALPTDTPNRTLVNKFFSRRAMPQNSAGIEGKERVNRIATAKRGSAGPNTEFVDFFNADLMPGIEMSGGYGLFQHQGRLPAHMHDFDESISIISGKATCIVEGRRYEIQAGGTALQPRGRVHYFINNSPSTMEMVWVYAGPMPERIIVDEAFATLEGHPWS